MTSFSIRTYGWAQQLINESIDAQNNLWIVSGGNLTANDSIEYNRLEAQKNTLALIQQVILIDSMRITHEQLGRHFHQRLQMVRIHF